MKENGDEQEALGVRRAGENLWRWSGIALRVVENTVPLTDLDPVIEGIQPEFAEVTISRRVAGPMAGGLFPEAALVLALAVVSHGFLSELGKDLYKGFRAALYAVYRKVRTSANGRTYVPLSIEIATEDGAVLVFLFPTELNQDEFEAAFRDILRLYPQVLVGPKPREPWYVIFELDLDSRAWRRNDTL